MISKNVKVLLASSLLLTLVSCGDDSKSRPSAEKSEDQIVQSHDMKISNRAGFPTNVRVEVNHEEVLDTCHPGKTANHIDRTASPEVLTVVGVEAPTAETYNVNVLDYANGCSGAPTSVLSKDVGYSLSKSGALGLVMIEL